MLTRRRLIGGAVAALALGAIGVWPEPSVLRAVMRRVMDGAGDVDALGSVEAAEAYVAKLPWTLRVQVQGLLRAVQWRPFLAHGSRFTRLEAPAQDEVLGAMARSNVALERQMMAALKQICAMGHYQHAEVWATMGYPGPLVGR